MSLVAFSSSTAIGVPHGEQAEAADINAIDSGEDEGCTED